MSHTLPIVAVVGLLLVACASPEDPSARRQRAPFPVASAREPTFALDPVREAQSQTRERARSTPEVRAYTAPASPRPPAPPPPPRPPGPTGPGPK